MRIVTEDDLHLDILPPTTRRAFLASLKFDFLNSPEWYLAGGTALALQVGHRKSVDLDFFTTDRDFHYLTMETNLLKTGKWTTTSSEAGTLYGLFDGAKMSFIAYPFFRPEAERLLCGAISILTPHDIAAMKIIAVSQRGRKRDFVDLYWYCHHLGTLPAAIKRAVKQFPEHEHSLPHFIKSLAYFHDAEPDIMPELYFKADWRTIKSYFKKEAPKVAKELLEFEG